MELSTIAEKIISQADEWTLAGDCSLLQWMEEIAHNLEQRVSTTTQTLGQLSTNLKRTTTALDNVSNSLAALQYTQFVESRCHDDDETIANITDVPVDVAYNNQAPEDTNKLWKNFMEQNFKVLHNCHERYAIELLDDSDEEDNLTNFIYQAKNPYNERLLPHIYGSNLWKENWHVGLCDGSNEYSGDEISEAFSESSSITSPEENESSESTASNLSEWASSTSITNEKQTPHLKIQNASSLRGSQPLFPEETIQRATKIAAGSSDTSSSTSRNTLNQIKTGFVQNQPRYDLFAPIQDIPPTSTTTSSSSSLNQQFSNSAQSNTNIRKDFLDTNVVSSPIIGVSPQSNTNQIRRRPVNLFDDDDFNNFMTEIVDKVNQKQEPELPPAPVARKQSSISSVTKTKEQEINTPATEHFSALVQEPAKARPAIEKEKPVKKKTLNLFDDSIDLFPPTTDISATVTKVPPIDLKNDMRTRITAKSLFDDDDEDDDFLNIFASKKPNTTKPIEKTILFNDNEPKHAEVNFEKIEAIVGKNNLIKSSPIKDVDIFKDTTSLFSDSDEVKEIDEVFDKSPSQIRDNNKISENNINEQQKINIPEEHENNIADVHSPGVTPQKIDLFSEFSKNKSSVVEKPNQVEINTSKKSLLLQKVSLFDDSESDDDNIFGNSVKAKTLLASKKDNLFGDDLLPVISPVKTTEESEKYDSAVFNKVDTSQGIEQVSEEQSFRDEKIFNMSSNQPINSSESENVQDKSSNPIESSSLSKNSLTSANDFQQLGDNVENDFKILVHSQKVQESAPPLVEEETSQLLIDDKVQKPAQLPVDDKVQETLEPLVDDKVQETLQAPVDDEVQKTLEPLVDDKVQETAQPLEDKEAVEVVQPELSDESSTVITNIASTIENKIPNTYAGLFLDEPPEDDDAFFQSLDSSALSSSKFSHDLEAEFYEPALPKPPTEVTNPTTSVSTYTSMGLFSDIPPDDDLEDSSFNSNSTGSSEITKRIHSVFYDDFKETIAAVNKKPTEVSTTLHTIFNDEPPPDNDDDFATLLQGASNRKTDTTTNVANDKVVPISQDVLDKAKPNTADDTKNAVENIKVKSSSSISKLQMPKININVQALLPPSVKKTIRELPIDSTNAEKSNWSKANNSFTSPQPSACSPTATNANILVNVCKNRVRAPAKRRPSTRRARQENYRKSLTAEQDERDNEDEAGISTEQKVENLKTSEQAASIQQQHAITEEINSLGFSKSFFEINNDNTKASSKIIDTSKTLDKNVVKHQVKAATLYPSESIEKSTIANITSKTVNISKGLFDDFNDDGDDDFLSTKKINNQSKVKTSLDSKPIKNSVQEELKSKIARQSENISESKKGENKDLRKALFQDDNDTQTVDNLKTSVSKKSSQKEMPAKSLFEDQNESDSDELFGTKKVLQTKNTSNVAKIVETKKAKVIAKATPLFSSDDDAVDDDSKEINKFEKSLKKAGPTKTLTKSTEKAVTKGLFSDTDDDDDDLFSSKSATKANFSKAKDKHIKSAKTHLSNQEKKSASISTTPAIKTTDNPLADLLNN